MCWYDGVFREFKGKFFGTFCSNLEIPSSVVAEEITVIKAISSFSSGLKFYLVEKLILLWFLTSCTLLNRCLGNSEWSRGTACIEFSKCISGLLTFTEMVIKFLMPLQIIVPLLMVLFGGILLLILYCHYYHRHYVGFRTTVFYGLFFVGLVISYIGHWRFCLLWLLS